MPITKGVTLRETLYGRVRLGQYIPTQATAATTPLDVIIKEYNCWQVEQHTTKDGQVIYEDATTELHVHSLLHHRNIVQLYDTIHTKDKIYAILEYCSGGELFTLIKQQEFDHKQCQLYFSQLSSALHYCHSLGIAHRDISLENILMDGHNQMKLCDFGLAYDCNVHGQNPNIKDGKRVGKLKYMSAEVFASEPYNAYKADVWSLGVVLFIMLTGVFPFDLPSVDDARCVQACRGSTAIQAMIAHWQLPAIDPMAADLLGKIFTSPEQRVDTFAIMNHPYVTAITGRAIQPIITAPQSMAPPMTPTKNPRKITQTQLPHLQTPIRKQSQRYMQEIRQENPTVAAVEQQPASYADFDSRYISPACSRAVSMNSPGYAQSYVSTQSDSSSNSSMSAFSPISQLNTPSSSHDSALMHAARDSQAGSYTPSSRRRTATKSSHDITHLTLAPMAMYTA